MKAMVLLLAIGLAGCASRGAGENRDYDAPGRVGTSYGLPDSPHTL